MALPRGFEQPGKVFKLSKSVYGLAQAPLAWFNKLSQGLQKVGFQPSNHDPCLFISDKVICIVYVDDCLMFTWSLKDIDKKIKQIKDVGFTLCIEEDAAGFLGIELERNDDGTIELKQSLLIDRIIETI